MLQTECVCRTAAAGRAATISRCSRVSADGSPAIVPIELPSLSTSRMSLAVRSPFCVPLRVMASRSGASSMTMLKLPLVPRTQPRVSRRCPIRIRRAAASVKSTAMGYGTSIASGTTTVPQCSTSSACFALTTGK